MDTDEDIKCEIEESGDDSEPGEYCTIPILSGEYFCDECPSKFTSEKNLVSHKNSIHEKCYICPECGFQIIGRVNYHNHMRKHKKVKCDTCSKEITKRKIAQHRTNCGKQKVVHKCDTCGYEATSSARLEKHRKKHNRVQKTFQCEYCEYKSPRGSNLTRHLETCRGKKRETPPPGPVSNDDLTAFFSKAHVSKDECNGMINFFMDKFGKVVNNS